MKFHIDYSEFNDCGIPIYRKSEQAFDFEPYYNSDFSLMLGASYVGLEINLNNSKVLCLSGVSPTKVWKKDKIILPNYKKGTLFVEGLENCFHGMGKETHNQFTAFYDKKSGWIYFASDIKSEELNCIMFAKDTIIALDDETIVSIWIKPKFI